MGNPKIPARNGGNNKKPALGGKIGMPPKFKDTYGAGTGAGGGSDQAKNGGNHTNPALGGKIGLPPNHDSYNPPTK